MPALTPNRTNGRIANHAPVRGGESNVYLARLPVGIRRPPKDLILVVGVGGAAKGTTSIPLATAITATADEVLPQAGQYLMFVDADGIERLVELAQTVQPGDDALTVVALSEPIAAEMESEFPTYLWDRTAADIDRSYSLSSVTTFNTGDSRDGVVTGNEKGLTVPGLYYFQNAAYKTALAAADEGRECWVYREIRRPSDAYKQGDVTQGAAVVTAAPSPSAVDGQVGADLTFAFVGAVEETDAIPVD